jgi:hypothetical protein
VQFQESIPSERAQEASRSCLSLLLYSYSFLFFLPLSFREFSLEIFKELLSSSVERGRWANADGQAWLMEHMTRPQERQSGV